MYRTFLVIYLLYYSKKMWQVCCDLSDEIGHVQGGMDIDSSIFLIGHCNLLGNSKCIGSVLAPPLFRDMEMTWMGCETHAMCQVSLCHDKRELRWWKGKMEANRFSRWSHSCGFTSAEISKVKSSKLNDSNNGECLLLVWAEYFRCFVFLNSHNSPLSHQADFYCSHCTSEEIEAWKVLITCPIFHN